MFKKQLGRASQVPSLTDTGNWRAIQQIDLHELTAVNADALTGR